MKLLGPIKLLDCKDHTSFIVIITSMDFINCNLNMIAIKHITNIVLVTNLIND